MILLTIKISRTKVEYLPNRNGGAQIRHENGMELKEYNVLVPEDYRVYKDMATVWVENHSNINFFDTKDPNFNVIDIKTTPIDIQIETIYR